LLAQGQSSAQISNLNKQLKLSGKKLEDTNATLITNSSQLAEDKVTLIKENAELVKQNAELKKQLEHKQALPPETPPTTNNLGKTGLEPTPTRTNLTEVPDFLDLPDGRDEPVPPKGKKDVQLEYVKFKAKMELLLDLSRDENIGHSVVNWAALLNDKAYEKLKDASQVEQIEKLFLQVGEIAPPQIEGEETRNLIDLLRIHPTGNDVVDDAVNDVLVKRVNNLEESINRKQEAQVNLKDQLSGETSKKKELEGILKVLDRYSSQDKFLEEKRSQAGADLSAVNAKVQDLNERLNIITTDLVQQTNLVASVTMSLSKFKKGREQVAGEIKTKETEYKALKAIQGQLNAMVREKDVDHNTTILGMKNSHGFEIARIKNQFAEETEALKTVFQKQIEDLKSGYDSHRIIIATTNENPAVWIEGLVNRAKEDAVRITSETAKEVGRIDENLQKLMGQRESLDKQLTGIKNKTDYLLNIMEVEKLDSNETVAAAFNKTIGDLKANEEALETRLIDLKFKEVELKGNLADAKDSHDKASKEQNRVTAEINTRWRELKQFFVEPSGGDRIPLGLVQSIESQIKECSTRIGKIQIGIDLESKVLQESELSLSDLFNTKRKLERELLGKEGKIDAKIASEMSGVLKKIEDEDKKITKLKNAISLNRQIKSSDEKLLEKLKLAHETLNPTDALAQTSGSLIIEPQGGNFSQCSFIVKLVPEKVDKSFNKSHKEQITELEGALRDVNLFIKLASFQGNTEDEKQRYMAEITNRMERVFQGNTPLKGVKQASYSLEGISGKIVVYGMALSESGKAEIFVKELDAEPRTAKIQPGVGIEFSFEKKDK